VHCQAGVGRTGILLACMIMDKLGVSATKALRYLRRVRPSSLQFSNEGWSINPFVKANGEYRRNFTQERFLERWDESRDIAIDRVGDKTLSVILSAAQVADLDSRIDAKLAWFETKPEAEWVQGKSYDCYLCENVYSIGPFPASSDNWKRVAPEIVDKEGVAQGDGGVKKIEYAYEKDAPYSPMA
jgi:hypothetical protein